MYKTRLRNEIIKGTYHDLAKKVRESGLLGTMIEKI